MDGDRKYRQRGYMDSFGPPDSGTPRLDGPRPPRPKLPLDVTGPRLPRMVQTVTAARCWNCATTLPPGVDFKENCPKCSSPLHCCKMCAHFEPSTRFQCLKPIPERIAYKDKQNECTLFAPRFTVAREVRPPAPVPAQGPSANAVTPKSADDARAAFDSLFKKE